MKSLKITAMFLVTIFASLGASYSDTYYPCPEATTITCKNETRNGSRQTVCEAKALNSQGEIVDWRGSVLGAMKLPLALTLKGPHHVTMESKTCSYNYTLLGEKEIMEFDTPRVNGNFNCYISSNPWHAMGWTCRN